MRVWVEVPDDWGWGPVRVLRGRLDDAGYWTGEYRLARGIMIRLAGSKPAEVAEPPAWRTVSYLPRFPARR
jgi:hypothetical protein